MSGRARSVIRASSLPQAGKRVMEAALHGVEAGPLPARSTGGVARQPPPPWGPSAAAQRLMLAIQHQDPADARAGGCGRHDVRGRPTCPGVRTCWFLTADGP